MPSRVSYAGPPWPTWSINTGGMEGTRPFSSAGRSQLTGTHLSGFLLLGGDITQFHLSSFLHQMLFTKFAGLFLLCFTIIAVACPISERPKESDGLEVYIAPTLFKSDPSPVSSL
jgi:hypothetical protein